MPEFDLHRQDLRTYQSISTYPSPPEGSSSAIPPLLIAFILDTSELPSGQALLWNRACGRVTLNAGLSGSGKGKEKETDLKSGIVLERWTFKAS
jgi:autophagy-related protein 13